MFIEKSKVAEEILFKNLGKIVFYKHSNIKLNSNYFSKLKESYSFVLKFNLLIIINKQHLANNYFNL